MVGYLLVFWLTPKTVLSFDPNVINFLDMLFMLEFLFGHASVFSGVAYYKFGLKGLLGTLCFYSLFFVPLMFNGHFFSVLLYLIALLTRFLRQWPIKDKEQIIIAAGQGFFRVMFLLICSLTFIIPAPMFGLENNLFAGKQLMLESPSNMMLFLVIYFALVHQGEKFVEKLLIKANI